MWLRRPVTGALALLMCVGCAKVTHVRVVDDVKEEGIRYYQAAPYLLIHSDAQGGIVWRILYLPDQTRKMAARPFNLFAKQDVTLNFAGGVLTSSKDITTADAVPKAIVAAVEKVAPLLLGMARAELEREVPAPYLFKIVVQGPSVQFFGKEADATIKMTLPQEDSQ